MFFVRYRSTTEDSIIKLFKYNYFSIDFDSGIIQIVLVAIERTLEGILITIDKWSF